MAKKMKRLPYWIKEGLIVEAYDQEEKEWYKAQVSFIQEDRVHFEDIDINSPSQGMSWWDYYGSINNKKLYRRIIQKAIDKK
jgi:hypothetical protein